MLSINADPVHRCLVVEPSGALSEQDFQELDRRFDAYVGDHGAVPNLVIHAKSFPGWEDFAGFLGHLRFVRGHHAAIGKVALASDARILSVMPSVASTFVHAQIRRFPFDRLEDAKAWVGEEGGGHGSVEIMSGLPDHVAGITVRGVVTANDYEETIIPLVEARLKGREKINFLYHVGPEFDGYSAGAVWDDARLGILNFTRFGRIAVVSDIRWIRNAVKLFGPLMPAQVQVFSEGELDDAKVWVAS